MLKNLDLTFLLNTPAFKHIRNLQRKRLIELEEMVFESKLPVLILFEGWDASGKGAVIRELTHRLDPRGFKVYETQAPRTLEKKMPWLWRFWMQIPRRGQIAIFDRSWYGRVLIERVEGLIPIPDWIRAYTEINNFERTLAADQAVFVKFWLQITEEEQLRRFIEMSDNPMTAWEISAEDWGRHRKYKEYEAALKDMLENTNTAYAPWVVISATDSNYCIYQVYCALINSLEEHLGLERTSWKSLKQLNVQAAKVKEEKISKKARKDEKKAYQKKKKAGEKEAASAKDTLSKNGRSKSGRDQLSKPTGEENELC